MSDFFDQHDKSTFELLPMDVYERLRTEYCIIAGGTPSEAEDPTPEQLSAFAQRLLKRGTPYADFAVWGPFGTDRAASRMYAETIQVNGQWVTQEVKGPANFAVWLASWRIFTCAALHLGLASTHTLKTYEDGICTLNTLYPGRWGHVYLADKRVRQEKWRVLMLDIKIKQHVPSHFPFDALRPWDYVIKTSSYGIQHGELFMFWQNKVLLVLASVATNEQAKAKMEALEGRVIDPYAAQPAGKRQRVEAPPGQLEQFPHQYCTPWNNGSCVKGKCPSGRQHSCSKCGGHHTVNNCKLGKGDGKKGGGKKGDGKKGKKQSWK